MSQSNASSAAAARKYFKWKIFQSVYNSENYGVPQMYAKKWMKFVHNHFYTTSGNRNTFWLK